MFLFFFFIIGLGLYSNANPFGGIWAPCTNYVRIVGLFLLADTHKIRELLNCKKDWKNKTFTVFESVSCLCVCNRKIVFTSDTPQ